MDEFDKFSAFKNENLSGLLGYLISFFLFFSQFCFWFFKKFEKFLRTKKQEKNYFVKSPYFQFLGEITRLDIFLTRNLRVASSEVFFKDLLSLYNLAKEKNLESIKIELPHYGEISHNAGFAIERFIDHVAEFNGIRVVIKFPANSSDAVQLYHSLKKHRTKTDSGRVELYLNDYSEDRSKNFLKRSPIP